MNNEKALAMEDALEQIKSRLNGIARTIKTLIPTAANDDGDMLLVALDSAYRAFEIADQSLEKLHN